MRRPRKPLHGRAHRRAVAAGISVALIDTMEGRLRATDARAALSRGFMAGQLTEGSAWTPTQRSTSAHRGPNRRGAGASLSPSPESLSKCGTPAVTMTSGRVVRLLDPDRSACKDRDQVTCAASEG